MIPDFLSIHPAFLLLLAFLFYRDDSGVTALAALACVLHEFGHIFVLLWQRKNIRKIYFTPFGVRIELGSALSYSQELFAAAAGPLVNLGLAFLGCYISSWTCFSGLNLALGTFNLLPLGELDGARIFQAALALCGADGVVHSICRSLEWCLLIVLTAAGFVLLLRFGNPTLLLTAGWLAARHIQKNEEKFQEKESN